MNSDLKIFTLTLFGEARGEPIESIIGVANVIRNRLQLGRGKSYTEICLQAKQFSCWNFDDPNNEILQMLRQKIDAGEDVKDIFFRQCLVVANAITNWDFRDNTNGATNYLANWLYHSPNCPSWARNGRKTIELGNHIYLIVA